jgi:heme oxygenase
MEKRRYRDVYESILIDYKSLAKIIGEAVRDLHLETEVYRGLEELMIKH